MVAPMKRTSRIFARYQKFGKSFLQPCPQNRMRDPLYTSTWSLIIFNDVILVYIVNLFIFVMPLRLKRIAVNGKKYVNQNVMGREGLQRQEALHHLPRDRHRRQGFQWICRCAQGLPLLARPAIVLSMNKISAYLRRHMNIPMCSYPVLEYARSGFRSQWRTCPQTKVSVRVPDFDSLKISFFFLRSDNQYIVKSADFSGWIASPFRAFERSFVHRCKQVGWIIAKVRKSLGESWKVCTPYTGATTNFQSSEVVLRQSPPKSA